MKLTLTASIDGKEVCSVTAERTADDVRSTKAASHQIAELMVEHASEDLVRDCDLLEQLTEQVKAMRSEGGK